MTKLKRPPMTDDEMPRMIPLPMREGDSHRRWKMLEDWKFEIIDIIFFIPKGFIFNGASVPRIFSNIFPSTGYLFLAALIHDYLYQHACYVYLIAMNSTCQNEKIVSRAQADDIFEEITDVLYPEHEDKTALAKAALVVGGQSSWDECRKADGTYVEPETYVYGDGYEGDDWLPRQI